MNTLQTGTRTAPWSDVQLEMQLLLEVLPPIRRELNEAILEYRSSWDLEALRVLAEDKVRFVAQCFGYAAGRLDALGVSLREHSAEVHALLALYGLLPAWTEAFGTLQRLNRERMSWTDVSPLLSLIAPCKCIMSAFGLHYGERDGGGHIDIPFTPETTPGLHRETT